MMAVAPASMGGLDVDSGLVADGVAAPEPRGKAAQLLMKASSSDMYLCCRRSQRNISQPVDKGA